MSEAWPSNASVDALDGTTDSATGLVYVPSNTGPSSSPTLLQQLNRFFQRLFRGITPATQGRVGQSDAGALKIIIYPIDYTLGGSHKSYAGADNQSVTDAATNYVYINASNALVINTTGFPADITTFYRLATVVCSGGVITAINDQRGFNNHVVPLTTSSSDSGTDNASFIIDADNAGAGADTQVRFNRGSTDAEDAAVEWDETNDRFNFRKQHSTSTQSPINTSAVQIAGTALLDSNGAAKVQSAVAGSGLSHSAGVLSVSTASASGTAISGGGVVSVDPSDGIALDGNGVRVALTSVGGLELAGSAGSKTLGVAADDATIECDSGTGDVQLKNNGTHAVKLGNNNGVNGSGLVIFSATLVSGNTVSIHNADAPYKYQIVDAWSVAKSADGGTWKLDNGTNDITNAVTVTGTDKTRNGVTTIDDAYYTIAASGTLRVVGDGANADAIVYVLAMRVA